MAQITGDSHFVSQMYLKQWSEDGNRIWSYRMLVSHVRVPKWTLRPIRGVAFHRDLYTAHFNGQESDEFERWLNAEFEGPAQEALAKVVHNKSLTPLDWERLARFLAAQDVRTPTSYVEVTNRWENELPELLDNVLKESVRRVEQATRKGQAIEIVDNDPQLFKNALNVQITPSADPESGKSQIRAEFPLGRALWLESQRLLLNKTVRALLKHKWSIVEPAGGAEWFTNDHPVVRLNYYKDGTYDLKGGWGNPGTDLIMPLSPYHLLFTEIGAEEPDRFTFSAEKTSLLQGFIAERALRWIFALKPMTKVEKLRPRHIDAAALKAEEEQRKKWHSEQNKAEGWLLPNEGS